MTPISVVLVHGAMHTPWVWGPVIESLQEDAPDVLVEAVQLPSSNQDSAQCRGLVEDAAAVRAAISRAPGRVVLVAHSYGGVPATWAASDGTPAVSDLLYVAAFALQPQASMMEWMGGAFPPGWAESTDGLAVRVTDPAAELYSGVAKPLQDEAIGHLQWQGIRAFTDRLDTRHSPSANTHYIVATEDPALSPAVQQDWALNCSTATEIPSGHSPHLSHPSEVAAAILRIVSATGKSKGL